MRPHYAPASSHRRPTGRVLGAVFGRRLLALRKVRARRLRPAGRLTCRVHGRFVGLRVFGPSGTQRTFAISLGRDFQLQNSVSVQSLFSQSRLVQCFSLQTRVSCTFHVSDRSARTPRCAALSRGGLIRGSGGGSHARILIHAVDCPAAGGGTSQERVDADAVTNLSVITRDRSEILRPLSLHRRLYAVRKNHVSSGTRTTSNNPIDRCRTQHMSRRSACALSP